MKSWKQPTPEQLNRAVALLTRPEHYRYFFDRLENPEWIMPLKEKGFFQHAPQIQRDEERRIVGFPPWPESRYLARMASLKPDIAEIVLNVILHIPDTENVLVLEDFADAALNMPPDSAARLLEKAKNWVRSPYNSRLQEKLGMLVAHLARGGKVDEALELARVLLEILPDPAAEEAFKKGAYFYDSPEPRARFETWEYERILQKYFPELLKAAESRAFELLCDLLETAIRFSRRRRDDRGPEDNSHIWWHSIEDYKQYYFDDLRNILVSAVRDGAESLAQKNRARVRDLVQMLELHPWKIFHRIALHLLSCFPNAAPDIVAARLTDRNLFDDDSVHREFVRLLDAYFCDLDTKQQQLILSWIDAGPDLQKFIEVQEHLTGSRPANEEAERYRRRWQWYHLAWIKKCLPDEWSARYKTLVTEFGEPEPEKNGGITSGWVRPTSPKSAEELQNLSVTDIVEFLKTWEPAQDLMAPSPEGLGRVLSSVVSQNPEQFAREAEKFQGLDPTYIRALLTGLHHALKQNHTFDWSNVFKLCQWIVEQPREIPGRVQRLEADPDWGRTRRTVADLLSAGFGDDVVGPVPIEQRKIAWDILKPLTDDPDPAPEDESKSELDPATLSINKTRGTAMHAVIQYALWIRRHLENLPDADARIIQGFAEFPEVREVLENHLDPLRDPSLAIRSVYGQWFPWLVLLDPEWAKERVDQIFPLNEPQRKFWEAAWQAYVVFCPPYDNVFELLRHQYLVAVECLGLTEYKNTLPADPDRQLAEHLMVYYWRGKLDIADPNGLLNIFWRKAPDSIRGHAIAFIGLSLENTEEEIPPEILDHLKSLWELRLAQAKTAQASHKAEMAAFSRWFISGKLDKHWAIKQLLEALKIAGYAELDHILLERLAALAQEMPSETVQYLKILVEGQINGWKIYAWRDEVRTILATALQSPDPGARQAARELVNYLGGHGYFEFLDLLK